MNVGTVLGLIGHDLKVVGSKVVSVVKTLLHDADAIFHVTLDCAKALGFSDDQILATVKHYEEAGVAYVEGKIPEWDAKTVAYLQNAFVKDSLVEKLGMGHAASQLLTSLVGRLYASGSSKLPSLVDAAVRAVEASVGLGKPTDQPPAP